MDKQLIACIVGTRPEAIKMAPVVLELRRQPDLKPLVISTGQHRELLRQALSFFAIEAEIDLDIMTENQTLAGLSAQLLQKLPSALEHHSPRLVLVQGDTTSAFIGALAAFYEKFPVGHVEAGLRTGDREQPFPEEINRTLISSLAQLHFAPTENNLNNLLAEGVNRSAVFVTGNTVIDALLTTAANSALPINPEVLKFQQSDSRKILVTAHRRENFGEPIHAICSAVLELTKQFSDIEIIFSAHPNQRAGGEVKKLLANQSRIHIIEPCDYPSFVRLLQLSHLILTDSGGIQEEAPSLGKPVLVLRNVTERPEAVLAGTVAIVGTDAATIVSETSRLLTDFTAYTQMAQSSNPYGNGRAASRIVETIRATLAAKSLR